ncbi:hypothetical protein MRX96_014708 [Rhipicephalus microplus]
MVKNRSIPWSVGDRFESEGCRGRGDFIVILFTRQLNERNLSLGGLWSCDPGWMWIEGSSSNTGCQSSRSGSRLARVAWPHGRGGKAADDEGDDRLMAGDVIVILFTRHLNQRNLSLGGLWSCGPGWMESKGLRRTRDVSRLGRGHDSPVLPDLAGEEERQQMTKGMIV